MPESYLFIYLFSAFSFHRGKHRDDLGVGVALARGLKLSFGVHLISAAGTCTLSELTTKALPQAVPEFID